ASGSVLNFLPQAGDDPVNFEAGAQLALVSDCQNTSVLPVGSSGGTSLTIGNVLTGTAEPTCSNPGNRDLRVFNLSKDFVTGTYDLAFREDDNPDGRPIGANPRRLVPVLMRREHADPAQELVRGVDELKFRYGVQDSTGNTRYLTAEEMEGGAIACP